jgi:hypothetical protein
MFNKNKKSNPIRPADKSAKDKNSSNKNIAANLRDNKDTKQQKSAMRSEGGKN